MAQTPPSSSAPPPDEAEWDDGPSFLGGFLRGLLWTIVWFAVLGGVMAGTGVWLRAQWDKPGPLAQTRAVVVPRGGTSAAAAALKSTGIIENTTAFEALTWLTIFDGNIRAAEFLFPPKASIAQVLEILRQGKPVEHRLTIIEGLTAKQIAALLTQAEAAAGPVEVPQEGTILPQTYAFDRGMKREAILARARAAMDKELAAAWAARAPGLPLASPRDMLIMASIVERETAKAEERPHVAAVYLNRLRIGMKLQADPTVAYGASGGSGVLDHKLNRADLERDDPYNTYRRAGLPPGPICSPGVASLRAVSRPMNSEDLYFVANGTGGHTFARTAEGHARNVARWRAIQGGAAPDTLPVVTTPER